MHPHASLVSSGTRRFLLLSIVALVTFLAASTASAVPASVTLPDTPVGRIGGELIHHVNHDTPVQIREWTSTILSPAIDAEVRTDFANQLALAARDSGGVDLLDVRLQSGLLVLQVQGRRDGQRALFVLATDPAQPGKLAQADLVPMADPALFADWPKGAVSRAELPRLINAALDLLVRTDDFSGCVTVSDGENTVFDECRGLAERRFGVPIDQQTKFRIASIGKMFTAVAIAQLVEDGKLSWDDTLAELVPEYPDQTAAKKITVWELLHHTSGLGDFLGPEFFHNREKFADPADYLDLIARQPKLSESGTQWNYSNAGFILLGRVIENVSGESYFDYIMRHVFTPAAMNSSGFGSIEEITPKLAVGYFHEGLFSSEWKANWMKIPFKGGPAGGAYSTNADLLRFAKALREGKLVKQATLAKMFDDEVPAGPGFYATGIGDRLSHGRHIRGHQGGIEGVTTDLAIVWETGATVALTSNQGPSQTWLLAERIADLLAAEGATP